APPRGALLAGAGGAPPAGVKLPAATTIDGSIRRERGQPIRGDVVAKTTGSRLEIRGTLAGDATVDAVFKGPLAIPDGIESGLLPRRLDGGPLELDGSIAGPARDPKLSTSLNAASISIAGFPLTDVKGRLTATATTVELAGFVATVLGGTTLTNARFEPASTAHTGEIRF